MSAPPHPPARGEAVAAVVIGIAVLSLIVTLGVVLLSSGATGSGAPAGDGLVAADVERDTPVQQPAPLGPDLSAWAAGVAARSGVPSRAVTAYGAAELAQREIAPDCRLSWATLAGIGRVESDHGRFGGGAVDADGVARPAIIGIPLDGTNDTREIRDSDGGRLDGDTVFDRAVGPMQFLPTTWERFGADGNGDGVRDPHQLDDAALAAAAYLCANDRDTGSGQGWWDGVLAYNASADYARLVWAAANRYATAAP